jgi:pimeloyl-ACP methyl ester carboxylesterase
MRGAAALLALGTSGVAGVPTAQAGNRGEFVTVGGVDLYFERSGQGPPVVLIHGASGNLRDWTFRVAPEIARTRTVIAFDRPGHGLSGMPNGGGVSIQQQAALLRGALARIGIERPVLVGHSYGGSVALAWAVDAPDTVSGVVLLAAPSQVWEGGLGLTNDLLASPVTGIPLAHAIPTLVTRGFAERTLATVFAPEAPPAGYLDHLDLRLVLQPRSLRENARQLVALKEELRPMVPAYPRLPMPIEALHGDADTTVGLDIHSKPLARQVAHARLTVLRGVGHMLHQVATPEVTARIDAVARAG